MTAVFVGVGSNVLPKQSLLAAVQTLGQWPSVRLTAISTFYRTAPLPGSGTVSFTNGVFSMESSLSPLALRSALRDVERACGRVRTADKNGPRTVDLDLLRYGDLVVEDRRLVLPSPDMRFRPFVVWPLFELLGDCYMTGLGQHLGTLAKALDKSGMTPLYELTRKLRGLLAV